MKIIKRQHKQMGNAILFYNNLTLLHKSVLLEKFKEKYRDSNIVSIYVKKNKCDEYSIDIDKYIIRFNSLPHLVNFVHELDRPFVMVPDFGAPDRGYNICFIYSNKPNEVSKEDDYKNK
jgi:hypothetical protein